MEKSDMQKVVYTPESQLRHPIALLKAMFTDLVSCRGLAWRLAIRDISAQYRQALFGLLWAFILPLVNTVTWIFLNGSGIVTVSDTTIPYPVYVFSGTMLWAIFVDALNAPLQQMTGAKTMLAKVNFPREAIVLSGLLQTIFNALIKVALIIIALIALGVYPNWQLVLFPLALLSLLLVGTVIGVMLTPLGLLYTDIGKIIPLAMQFFMYITPVVFALPERGLARTLFLLNPLTPIILTARDWLTGMAPSYLNYFVLVNVSALLILVLVWVIFRLAVPILVERMNA